MLLNPSRHSSPARRSPRDWLNAPRFAGLLAVLLAVTFPGLVTGINALAYGDAGQFAYPVAFFHRESFWRGELPFWNSLNSCGLPFLAQWNTLVLYPPSLFYLLFPMPWSFGVFCILHLLLGGSGMFSLAHRWTGSRFAAVVAGTAFSFNGLTWYGLMWPHLLAALAWMPWVVIAMERAWREGKQFIALAALTAGLQLLTGGAEAILETWLVLASLCVLHLVSKPVPARTLVLRAFASCFLGLGIAAVQLMPFLNMAAASQRGAGFAAGGMAAVGAMPLSGWANFLVPLYHCVPNYNGVFVQVSQSWTGSYYLGISIVALGLLAAWRIRNTRVWLLLGLILFGILMALGSRGHFYDWVKDLVPLLGSMRFTVKFVMLAVFALPLLAAFGLKWLMDLSAQNWRPEWRRTLLLAAGLAVLAGLIAWYGWQHAVSGASPAIAARNACGRVVFLALTLVCVAVLKHRAEPAWQRLLQLSVVALLWLDVLTHSSNLSPTVPAAALQPNMIRQYFKWDGEPAAGHSRAMVSREAFWKMLSSGSPELEKDVAARRLALFMNYNLLDHVPKVDGFYSMDLKHFLTIFQRLYFTTNQTPGLEDFLAISHVNAPGNIVDWVSRPSALPIVTAGQRPVFAEPEETLQRLFASEFNPRQTVYLPADAQHQVRVDLAACTVTNTRFASRRFQAEVEAAGPALVVIAQADYPCWHAYVDGKPAQLWRANYAFQAVEVPSGKHFVELLYEDRAFTWGLGITAGCVLLCAFIWWRGRSAPTIQSTPPASKGAGQSGARSAPREMQRP